MSMPIPENLAVESSAKSEASMGDTFSAFTNGGLTVNRTLFDDKTAMIIAGVALIGAYLFFKK